MFGIYDNLISDYVPGLQKYDMCMTEQVPGPQGVKIVGRHIASAPYVKQLLIYPGFCSCVVSGLVISVGEFQGLGSMLSHDETTPLLHLKI